MLPHPGQIDTLLALIDEGFGLGLGGDLGEVGHTLVFPLGYHHRLQVPR